MKYLLGVAAAAFTMGLIVALGIVLVAGNHVPVGAVVAFVTGLVAAFVLLFAGIHSRHKKA